MLVYFQVVEVVVCEMGSNGWVVLVVEVVLVGDVFDVMVEFEQCVVVKFGWEKWL